MERKEYSIKALMATQHKKLEKRRTSLILQQLISTYTGGTTKRKVGFKQFRKYELLRLRTENNYILMDTSNNLYHLREKQFGNC